AWSRHPPVPTDHKVRSSSPFGRTARRRFPSLWRPPSRGEGGHVAPLGCRPEGLRTYRGGLNGAVSTQHGREDCISTQRWYQASEPESRRPSSPEKHGETLMTEPDRPQNTAAAGVCRRKAGPLSATYDGSATNFAP